MEMLLGAILKEKPQALFTISENASVKEAVDIMAESNVGCVMVMDHGRLQGLFTERDLMRRVVHQGRDPQATTVAEVMTTEIATVSPRITVGEAMALCTQKRLRHLPVYDDNNDLLGMVSAGDLTKWAISEQEHTIEDLTRYIYGAQA